MDPDPLGSVVFLKNKLNGIDYFVEKIITFSLLKVEQGPNFPFPKHLQIRFSKE